MALPELREATRSPYREDQQWEDAQPLTIGSFMDEARAYHDVEARRSALRAMPYRDYLKTDHWQATKKAALARAGYRCNRCRVVFEPDQRWRLNVHHLTYDRRGAEDDADLEVLCRACHADEHGKTD